MIRKGLSEEWSIRLSLKNESEAARVWMECFEVCSSQNRTFQGLFEACTDNDIWPVWLHHMNKALELMAGGQNLAEWTESFPVCAQELEMIRSLLDCHFWWRGMWVGGEQEDNRRDMRLSLQSGEQFDGSSNGDEQFKIHLESPWGQWRERRNTEWLPGS